MKLRTLIDRLRGAGAESVPFLAEYPLPGPAPVPKAQLGAIEGLTAWHEVTAAAGARTLSTYWASQAHFARSNATVEHLLGTVVGPNGHVGSIGVPPTPVWKRVKPITAILTTAAVFGAFEVLSNRYTHLFAAPSLSLAGSAARVGVVEDADLDLSLKLVNQIGTSHSDIKVRAELRRAGSTPIPLKLSPSEIPELASAGQKEIAVRATAPASGDYEVWAEVESKAGLLIGRKKHAETLFTVVAWPKHPQARVRHRTLNVEAAQFDSEVDVGPAAPQGLTCIVTIANASGLKYPEIFGASVGHRDLLWSISGPGDKQVGTLRFVLLDVTGKQRIHFDFVMQGAANRDWAETARNTKVECQGSP